MYIFDLDGTLANIEHRLHHITGDKKDWDAFFLDCLADDPIQQTIDIVHALNSCGHAIEIWSGRGEIARERTEKWLGSQGLDGYPLLMRPEGDFTDDVELKRQWLKEEGRTIHGVFDDRAKVVKMWREEGLTCYQVDEGDF